MKLKYTWNKNENKHNGNCNLGISGAHGYIHCPTEEILQESLRDKGNTYLVPVQSMSAFAFQDVKDNSKIHS